MEHGTSNLLPGSSSKAPTHSLAASSNTTAAQPLTHVEVLGDAALEHDERDEEDDKQGSADVVEHHSPLVDR